jgi:(1->4)-alpha-D-glucan 1-alpha-D-glucosylmutase
LVDPDNRRPVDLEALQRALQAVGREIAQPTTHEPLREATPETLPPEAAPAAADITDPRHKLRLTARLLDLRRRCPALFERGGYQPLEAAGPAQEHVVAYSRLHGEQACIVAGSRWPATHERADTGWRDTVLALPAHGSRSWRDVASGACFVAQAGANGPALALESVLARAPVAVLEAVGPAHTG